MNNTNFKNSKFKTARIRFLIKENAKSKIQVGDAKPQGVGKYPFFTSGENILSFDDFLCDGETIFLNTGGNASVKFYDSKASYSTDTYAIKSINEKVLLTKFLFYCLNDATFINDNYFEGSALKHLQKDKFKNFQIPFPPLHEQQQIAEFLDKKCYAIDKTLQNLEQKIQTLTEYKKALITKCVCKGLNNSKNVNFKNIKISYLFNMIAGGDLPNLISDVKTDELNIPIYSNGTDENALYGFTNIAKIHKPCITISGRGTIGFCALRKEPFYPIVRLLCLTPKTNEANINFLYYALKNVNFDFNQTAIPQLTAPMIKQIKIPLPPLHEQQQIAEFLDKKCNKIDRLNEIYNQQIQYLSEYKKSLIYEFVSGKKCI